MEWLEPFLPLCAAPALTKCFQIARNSAQFESRYESDFIVLEIQAILRSLIYDLAG